MSHPNPSYAKKDAILLGVIRDNPGIGLRGLIRRSGLASGTGQFHLKSLERNKAIRVARTAGATRFFERTISRTDMGMLQYLKQKPFAEILQILLYADADDLPFKEIVRRSGKAPSTVSKQLETLVNSGLISSRIELRRSYYSLRRRNHISQLYRKYVTSPG
jgi:predicted transcriptional regulator